MKIRDLIAQLDQHDPELEVVLSRDPEGNGFHRLNDLSRAFADPTDIQGGYEIEQLRWREDLQEYGESESDYTEVVVLWP